MQSYELSPKLTNIFCFFFFKTHIFLVFLHDKHYLVVVNSHFDHQFIETEKDDAKRTYK